MRPDGGEVTRVTWSPGRDGYPSWNPDGSRILFASPRTGDHDIWSANPSALTSKAGPKLPAGCLDLRRRRWRAG
jgi:Tol biopolymer transport system component